MHPLGFAGFNSHALMMPLMALFPVLLIIKLISKEGHSWKKASGVIMVVFVGAILGAKLFSLMIRDWQFYSLINEINGGWRAAGMLIGAVISAPIAQRIFLPKLSLLRFADLLGITMAFAMAFGRVGCFLTGCCVGERGQGILYLSYAPGSQAWYSQIQQGLTLDAKTWSEPVLALHPIFMFFSLSVGVFLVWFDKRKQYNGQVFFLFLLLHESTKAILELFRDPMIPEQLSATIGAACVGGLGIFVFTFVQKQQSKGIAPIS